MRRQSFATGDVISQHNATSKRVNQMGHHKKSRRQIMGLLPVLPADSVKLVFTRIPTFLSKKGINFLRGIVHSQPLFRHEICPKFYTAEISG